MKQRIIFPAVMLCLMLAISARALGAETTALDTAALLPKALVAAGDTTRLQHALAKARRGEPVTVAVIGGSITAGARATKPDRRYGNVIAAWWRQAFPKSKIEFVNAGVGATGTNFAALRVQHDLLAHQPDFVVVEFAVNDGNTRDAAETLEGLLRQILKQPRQPAVMMLFMMHRGGGNAQEWHSKVGAHYGLPMVSFRDALWPEIQAGRLKWETVIADEVHPNDPGHDFAAQCVIARLKVALKGLPADGKLPAIKPVPAALFSDLFEHTALCEAKELKPTANKGWKLIDKFNCWQADAPGSTIEFTISGRLIYGMHLVVKRGMGKARVQVDDRPPVVLNGWFNQTWGGYRQTTVLARDLPPGPHRVRIELLEEKDPGSDGHQFTIYGLGAAGVMN